MRINVIPVELLSDVHLRAEYREILMSCHYYRKSSASAKGIQRKSIPTEYTLNTGHATFFYNKFGYVKSRHDSLESEMVRRSFKIRESYDLRLDWILPHDMNNYSVTYKDLLINCQRVLQRIYEMQFYKSKPDFYKLRGKSMKFMDWAVLLTESLNLEFSDVYKIITELETKNAQNV